MKRRAFLAALAAIPFVRRFVPATPDPRMVMPPVFVGWSPARSQPFSMAGRLEHLTELVKMGIITPRSAAARIGEWEFGAGDRDDRAEPKGRA